MTLELHVSEILQKSCSVEVKSKMMYGDCLKNLNDPKLYHLLKQVVIQRFSGRYEYASVPKSKKEKKLLEITLWTHTNVVRSVGYGLDTVCHLQLDFYIHQLNLCWIFNLGFKFS